MDFIGDYWQTGAAGLSSIFSTILNVVYRIVYRSDHCFFLLRNPNKFYYSLLSIVPPRFRKDFNTIVKIADLQVGAFLKGQIISSFILGGIYWVIFADWFRICKYLGDRCRNFMYHSIYRSIYRLLPGPFHRSTKIQQECWSNSWLLGSPYSCFMVTWSFLV